MFNSSNNIRHVSSNSEEDLSGRENISPVVPLPHAYFDKSYYKNHGSKTLLSGALHHGASTEDHPSPTEVGTH